VWSFLVVVDEPALELALRLVEALEVEEPDGLLFIGPKHPLDEGVAIRVSIDGATQGDAEVAT